MATHSSALGLEDPMDGGAWSAIVHGVTKSQTQLSYSLSFRMGTGVIFVFRSLMVQGQCLK